MREMKRINLAIMAAGILCASFTFGLSAAAADRGACSADIEKFCKNIEPGAIALMDCLERHESELSGACKQYEATMGGRRVERTEHVRERVKFRQACLADMAKFCNDANPMPGGMIKCLNDHKNDISVSCSESIKALRD